MGREIRTDGLHRLSARRVAAASRPGYHADGGGLSLYVDPRNGNRHWRFIYREPAPAGGPGTRRVLALGKITDLDMTQARKAASAIREAINQGMDAAKARDAAMGVTPPPPQRPAAAPSTPKQASFKEEADALKSTLAPDWRGRKTEQRWDAAVDIYAKPFAAKPANEVTTDDVMAVLSPIWRTKPAMAQKVRSVWERVFDTARARANARAKGSWTEDNPARWAGHLALLLGKTRRLSRGHHAALPYPELPALMLKLSTIHGIGALALRFTILTGVRTTTALEATWGEIDLAAALWTIPLTRLKNAEEMHEGGFTVFQVPLSTAALEVLKLRAEARPHAMGPDDPVFPGVAQRFPSINTMRAVMLRLGYTDEKKATVHGFRTTFRVWAGRQMELTAAGREVQRFTDNTLEFAIGHVVGSEVQRAYDRNDYLPQRKLLMDAWAEFAVPAASEP